MFNFNQNNNYSYANQGAQDITVSRTFMSNVFSWMAAALAITAFFAYYFSTNDAFLASIQSVNAKGRMGLSGLGWIITLAPLAFVLIMSFGFNRLSASILTLLFIAFAFFMGMGLCPIFQVYQLGSIFLTFAVTAGTFGVMAVAGYTTKIDLTKFGSIMMMGLVGIIIASVVNFFLHSGTLDWIISIAGVLIFTGLTAYDVQKLKRIGAGVEHGAESTKKLVIMGALTLYLDFLNLFLFLLRFLGNRK